MKKWKNNALVGDTARACADTAMQANFAFLPSVVLVIMGSLPTVNPSVVDNLCFSWVCCVRVSDGTHEHGSLYQQHHIQKLLHGRYFRIHFFWP